MITVRQRDAGIGRRSGSGGYARHHLERNACGGCHLQLFATATKDKGITPLQAHHAFALLRQLHQQTVGFLLNHRVRPSAFTHADAFGVATHQIQDFIANQMVIQHHIGLLHYLQPAQGQQPDVARAGAHQRNFTLGAFAAQCKLL
ncbi:hypothetical protein D3C79_791350 [compost metagenome]